MHYGLNLLFWTDRLHDGLVPVVERIKALGYDGVEIPIFELDEPLHRRWGARFDERGQNLRARPLLCQWQPGPHGLRQVVLHPAQAAGADAIPRLGG